MTNAAQAFDAYTAREADPGASLTGYLVLFRVAEDAAMTPDELGARFAELGLDDKDLPNSPRAVDAFERATSSAKDTYAVDNPDGGRPARRRRRGGLRQIASLFVRDVNRDLDAVERHLVREVRDEASRKLLYKASIARVIFTRDKSAEDKGAGTMQVELDNDKLSAIPPAESARVDLLLDTIRQEFEHGCAHHSAAKLRGVVRTHLSHLNALRVDGGVYFVHHQQADGLAVLRKLVDHFGDASSLSRIPLFRGDETEELLVGSLIRRVDEELAKFNAKLLQARRDGATPREAEELYARFKEVRAAAQEHANLLDTSLITTNAALDLMSKQLSDLLTNCITPA